MITNALPPFFMVHSVYKLSQLLQKHYTLSAQAQVFFHSQCSSVECLETFIHSGGIFVKIYQKSVILHRTYIKELKFSLSLLLLRYLYLWMSSSPYR